MGNLTYDLRFGFRTLWRRPGFLLVGVVTLALGIGINLAVLSVVAKVFFRDLPYEQPERLMVLQRQPPTGPATVFSFPTFRDWKERDRSFEVMAAFRQVGVNLEGGEGSPERVRGLMATAELFQALGVEPVRGRDFRPQDDRPGAERTVIVSHELWQQRFGGDPGIVGKTLRLDGELYAVIGVLPSGLRRERLAEVFLGDLFLPMGLFHDRLPIEQRELRMFYGVGRLRSGTSAAEARRDMARIVRELGSEHPEAFEGNRLLALPIRESLVSDDRSILLLLLVTSGFLLLIACVNLVNLFLAHVTRRGRELATRMALGAGRGRLVRQLLVESFLLAVAGGGAGLLAAYSFLPFLKRVLDTAVAHSDQARIDLRIVATGALLTLLVSLGVGLIPALQVTRGARQRALGAGRGLLARGSLAHGRLRQSLVVVQLALALVLLIGTGLMVVTMRQLQSESPGFDTERVLTLQVRPPQSAYDDRDRWRRFFEQALERLRSLPEVESAAVSSLRSLEGDFQTIFAAGDRPLPKVSELPTGTYQLVSSEYFRTLGLQLVEGRDFDARDDDEHPRVVIVSEALARLLWPRESALDKRFAFEFQGTFDHPLPQWRRVVGVVEEARHVNLRQTLFAAYAPYTQKLLAFDSEAPVMTLIARTYGEPLETAGVVRETLREVDPRQPVYSVRAMSELLEAQYAQPRMASVLLSIFAVLALVLAAVGVYGMMSHAVAARTREFATRMALGATPARIKRLILRQTGIVLALGLGLGVLAALGLSPLISSQLYGVEAVEPMLYLALALFLAAVGMLATWVPARRAARMRPAKRLREE